MAALTYNDLRRKAQCGRRNWISWRDRSGNLQAAPQSPANIKAAMLAKGTAGRFTIVSAGSGISSIYGWRDGVRMLRNARFGC